VALNVVFAFLLAQVWTSLTLIGVTTLFASDAFLARLGDRVADRWFPIWDWLVVQWYAGVDWLDAQWFRIGVPVVDWFRATVLRR
jgi:hypothetical protein